jgi:hypothetical protein
MSLWQEISELADGKEEYKESPFYFFKVKGHDDGSHWVVGRHKDMLSLIDEAWDDKSEGARNFFEKWKVRRGLRSSDVIATPEDGQQKSSADRTGGPNHASLYATKNQGHYADEERVTDPARLARKDAPASKRARWLSQNKYWNSLHKPNSHHIVEYNVLELLKISPGTQNPSVPGVLSNARSVTPGHVIVVHANPGSMRPPQDYRKTPDSVSHKKGDSEFDYPQLPTMMLAADFHSRYFNPLLVRAREEARAGEWRKVCNEYRLFYEGQSRSFAPLWEISKIVLKLAFTKAKVRVIGFQDLV